MNRALTDPLDSAGAAVRYCAACDNNSSTYDGKFIKAPNNPEVRLQWLVRVGIVKPSDPFPGAMRIYVCDKHFDTQNDFTVDRRYGMRLRAGILPWRNMKTGTYSYHGFEMQTVAPCQCSCCKRNGSTIALGTPERRLAKVQTDDIESRIVEEESIQIMFYESQCRLCLQDISTTTGNLVRLFCAKTRKPACADLMEEIYVTVGLLFNFNEDKNAYICNGCLRQVRRGYRFRLQTRTNNRAFLATKALFKEKEIIKKIQSTHSVAKIEEVLIKTLEDDPSKQEPEIEVKRVKLEQEEQKQDIKEEQVDIKEEQLESDWLEEYGEEERLESDELLGSSLIEMEMEVYVKE